MDSSQLPAAPSLLASQLAAWFCAKRRDLPWRTNRSAYRVWLSEVMLQQTRVAVVCEYFLRFVARFPDVKDLAAASEDEVLSLWSGLGYYARGRNLHKAAQVVATNHDGVFPATSAALAALPGIGSYTAAAVASLAFGEQIAVLDGNVARVLARLCDDDTPIDTPAGKIHFAARAQALVDAHSSSATINEGLMELGALICTPRSPSCGGCPWSASCAGKGRAALLPVKARKKPRQQIRIACVVLRDPQGRVWLQKRASTGLFGGLWEPLGMIIQDDVDVESAWSTILRDACVSAPPFAAPIIVTRVLTHRELRFEIVTVQMSSAAATKTPATPTATADTRHWFCDRDLKKVGTSSAVRAVLAATQTLPLFQP